MSCRASVVTKSQSQDTQQWIESIAKQYNGNSMEIGHLFTMFAKANPSTMALLFNNNHDDHEDDEDNDDVVSPIWNKINRLKDELISQLLIEKIVGFLKGLKHAYESLLNNKIPKKAMRKPILTKGMFSLFSMICSILFPDNDLSNQMEQTSSLLCLNSLSADNLDWVAIQQTLEFGKLLISASVDQLPKNAEHLIPKMDELLIHVMTMEGYGTDIFVHLDHSGKLMEKVDF
eukprot:TRINITY_DN1180_c0_g1_i4.p1 TRINITY_DN1180_c0_g1~~TRINITY_DN1180_c0_g1_i4.p1  ORF type:complete len:232 (+),score=83.83 TRINITY_DN1180_c0_g1_i4:266-961(+)